MVDVIEGSLATPQARALFKNAVFLGPTDTKYIPISVLRTNCMDTFLDDGCDFENDAREMFNVSQTLRKWFTCARPLNTLVLNSRSPGTGVGETISTR